MTCNNNVACLSFVRIFVTFFTTFRAGLNIHFQISSICFYKSKNYSRKTIPFFSLSLILKVSITLLIDPEYLVMTDSHLVIEKL
jgi:hypothetical protein